MDPAVDGEDELGEEVASVGNEEATYVGALWGSSDVWGVEERQMDEREQ